MPKIGVVVFPGSNCDEDTVHVAQNVMGCRTERLWYREADLKDVDLVILPGGFSYGDYLRAGALARFAPILDEVRAFAARGGPVLGICNGFQILCESGMLPGVLIRNKNLQFVCRHVYIKKASSTSEWTTGVPDNKPLRIPIAHGEGNYFGPKALIRQLADEDRIAFVYTDENGDKTEAANPNGSLNHIAGILNAQKNIMGMMPHPERASEDILGSTDGKIIFESVLSSLKV